MRPRHAFVAIVLVFAVTAGCGSSDDGTADQDIGDPNGDDTQVQQDGQAGDDNGTGGGDNGNDGENGNGGDNGGDGDGDGQSPVGSFIQGTAVAGNAGGDLPGEQTGEVLRDGQRCYGHAPAGEEVWTSGLEEGASVTIRDTATGEEVGSGSIVGTSATRLESDPDDPMPVWECYFEISAEVTRVPDSFTVQVADLPPWPATFDSSTARFVVDVTVPGGGDTVSTAPPSPTETEPPPPTETEPPPPTETEPPSVTTPSSSAPEVTTSTT